jgi:hypothetical protein
MRGCRKCWGSGPSQWALSLGCGGGVGWSLRVAPVGDLILSRSPLAARRGAPTVGRWKRRALSIGWFCSHFASSGQFFSRLSQENPLADPLDTSLDTIGPDKLTFWANTRTDPNKTLSHIFYKKATVELSRRAEEDGEPRSGTERMLQQQQSTLCMCPLTAMYRQYGSIFWCNIARISSLSRWVKLIISSERDAMQLETGLTMPENIVLYIVR